MAGVVKDKSFNSKTIEQDSDDCFRESQEKGKELPEPLRPGSDNIMPGLPPIDIKELKIMLSSPNMPSHKILKEVADRLGKQPESDSEDGGSDGGSGKIDGMKGLFDCILEVSLNHNDSDQSDDDDDPNDEHIHRELPCSFCNKIFESTMLLKTHILVMHPLQDPSVHNINPVRGTRASLPLKKRRSSSKSNMGEGKGSKYRPIAIDCLEGVENIPVKSGKISPMPKRKSASSPGSEPKSPTDLSRVPVSPEDAGHNPGADASSSIGLCLHPESREFETSKEADVGRSKKVQSGQAVESSQESAPSDIINPGEDKAAGESSSIVPSISTSELESSTKTALSSLEKPSRTSSFSKKGAGSKSSAWKRSHSKEDEDGVSAKKTKTTRSRDIREKTSQAPTRRSSRHH